MTLFKIYLTSDNVVEASVTHRPDILIGEFEGAAEDMTTLLEFCQNCADAVIGQLWGKYHTVNIKELN